jgi:hypothetical protein
MSGFNQAAAYSCIASERAARAHFCGTKAGAKRAVTLRSKETILLQAQ